MSVSDNDAKESKEASKVENEKTEMAYSQPTKEGEAKQTQLPPTPPKEPSKFAPKPEARTRAKQIFSENIGIDPKEVEAKLKQEGLSLSLTKIYEVRKEVKLESKPTKEEPKAQITPAKVEEPKKEEPAPSPTTTQPFQVSYDEVRTFWRNADLVISKFARTNPIDESEIKMLTDAWHPFIQKYAPYLGKYAVELGAIATVGIVYAPRIVTIATAKKKEEKKPEKKEGLKEEPKKENPDAGQKKEETEGEGKSKGWGAITGAS